MQWLKELGFKGNPFSPEPIEPNKESLKGFINRNNEKRSIKRKMATGSGKYMVLGPIGVGKSSLLSVTEDYCNDNNFLVLKVDLLRFGEKEPFYNALLKDLHKQVEADRKLKKKIQNIIESIKIKKVIKKRKEKKGAKAGISLRLSIVELMGKVSTDGIREKEIEEYVRTRIEQVVDAFTESVSLIRGFKPVALFLENLDKYDPKEFIQVVKEIVAPLPYQIAVVTTGNNKRYSSEELVLIRETFGPLDTISDIETAEQLREFVDGRQKVYSLDGSIPIHFSNEALDYLVQRTQGNLREIFKYCYQVLIENIRKVSGTKVIETIKKDDRIFLEQLKEDDLKILNFLRAEKKTITEIEAETKIPRKTVQRRINSLVQLNLVFPDLTSIGKGKTTEYYTTEIIKELIST